MFSDVGRGSVVVLNANAVTLYLYGSFFEFSFLVRCFPSRVLAGGELDFAVFLDYL